MPPDSNITYNFATSKIAGNHPHSQTIIDTPTDIAQSSTPVIKHLNTKPFCLVSDSVTQLYIIDTGANRVIVNYPKLLSSFISSTEGVNVIGGNPVQIHSRGKLRIYLLLDSVKDPHIT